MSPRGDRKLPGHFLVISNYETVLILKWKRLLELSCFIYLSWNILFINFHQVSLPGNWFSIVPRNTPVLYLHLLFLNINTMIFQDCSQQLNIIEKWVAVVLGGIFEYSRLNKQLWRTGLCIALQSGQPSTAIKKWNIFIFRVISLKWSHDSQFTLITAACLYDLKL